MTGGQRLSKDFKLLLVSNIFLIFVYSFIYAVTYYTKRGQTIANKLIWDTAAAEVSNKQRSDQNCHDRKQPYHDFEKSKVKYHSFAQRFDIYVKASAFAIFVTIRICKLFC